jgi:hypothetical protein
MSLGIQQVFQLLRYVHDINDRREEGKNPIHSCGGLEAAESFSWNHVITVMNVIRSRGKKKAPLTPARQKAGRLQKRGSGGGALVRERFGYELVHDGGKFDRGEQNGALGPQPYRGNHDAL